MLVRATLMLPILVAARLYDEAGLGEYSRMYHQLLIVSTLIVFGVHDRITVEREVDLRSEAFGLTIRLVLLGPVVLVYADPFLALATLLFLHFSRSGPMVLFAASRATGAHRDYLIVCLATTVSSFLFVAGYALGWSMLASTLAATVVVIPNTLLSAIRSPKVSTRRFDPRSALRGWDYCLNFLFTSLFSQGVLFLTSFVTTSTEYASVSRVMYLVQAGLLIQSVSYRMVLSLMVDGTIRLRHVLWANAVLGGLWFVAMAVGGGWIEGMLFGSRELSGIAYLLIGFLVMFQTFNLALSPHLLAGRMVRRTLWVPATAGVVALGFAASWTWIDSAYTIYAMIAAITASGLLVRILLIRRMESE